MTETDDTTTPPDGAADKAGAGTMQPGAKGSPGLEDNDPANTIPTPEPGTDPLHEGGP